MSLVMGILNVTPDSFSDGGQFVDANVAVDHARAMLGAGATIIDVGGESTRPGADRVSAEEELARVIPIVRALAGDGVAVSVDTMRADVAAAAIDAGARIINDVSGGQADPAMFEVLAGAPGVDYVLMHWRGHSAAMSRAAVYADVVGEVIAETVLQRDTAMAAGIPGERIILDPGLGFAKTWDHNWTLLRNLNSFTQLGHRVLVGASRKAFLGELLGGREPLGRDGATAAVSFWCGLHDVWAVRTHDVEGQADAISVARRLLREDGPGSGCGQGEPAGVR